MLERESDKLVGAADFFDVSIMEQRHDLSLICFMQPNDFMSSMNTSTTLEAVMKRKTSIKAAQLC